MSRKSRHLDMGVPITDNVMPSRISDYSIPDNFFPLKRGVILRGKVMMLESEYRAKDNTITHQFCFGILAIIIFGFLYLPIFVTIMLFTVWIGITNVRWKRLYNIYMSQEFTDEEHKKWLRDCMDINYRERF